MSIFTLCQTWGAHPDRKLGQDRIFFSSWGEIKFQWRLPKVSSRNIHYANSLSNNTIECRTKIITNHWNQFKLVKNSKTFPMSPKMIQFNWEKRSLGPLKSLSLKNRYYYEWLNGNLWSISKDKANRTKRFQIIPKNNWFWRVWIGVRGKLMIPKSTYGGFSQRPQFSISNRLTSRRGNEWTDG